MASAASRYDSNIESAFSTCSSNLDLLSFGPYVTAVMLLVFVVIATVCLVIVSSNFNILSVSAAMYSSTTVRSSSYLSDSWRPLSTVALM